MACGDFIPQRAFQDPHPDQFCPLSAFFNPDADNDHVQIAALLAGYDRAEGLRQSRSV